MIKGRRPIAPDIESRLPQFVETVSRDDRVEALWIFGSRARNEADLLSDLDVAVLARRGMDSPALWDAELHWVSIAAETLRTDEAAVQTLNRLPVALRHAILRDARLLWARSPDVAGDFATQTLKEYLDFSRVLRSYDRDLFEQAVTGRLR